VKAIGSEAMVLVNGHPAFPVHVVEADSEAGAYFVCDKTGKESYLYEDDLDWLGPIVQQPDQSKG
jgi:hypothetical protein